jgi:hypothetical protein
MRWFLDGIRRIGTSHGHRNEFDGQALFLDECDKRRADLLIDRVERRGADRRLVHAALSHGLSDHRLELLLQIVSVPIPAEVFDERNGIRDLQHHDRVKADRHAVRGHRVVHLGLGFHRLHERIPSATDITAQTAAR